MSKGKSFIVYKSSAGSGKTFSLAKVYLSIILEHQDPFYFRHLLGMTFTVKAAAEMKGRILQYLFDIAYPEKAKRSDTQFMLEELKAELGFDVLTLQELCKARLKAILYNYGDFSLLTIDKFIARLIRSFSSELGLRPDFQITVDAQEFVDQAIELLLQEVGSEQALTDLVVQFLKMRLKDGKSATVDQSLSDAAFAMLSEEFFFVKSAQSGCAPSRAFELHRTFDHAADEIKARLMSLGKRALDVMHSQGVVPSDFKYKSSGIGFFFEKASLGSFDVVMKESKNPENTINSGEWYTGKENASIDAIIPELTEIYHAIKDLRDDTYRYNLLKVLSREVFTLGFMTSLHRLFDVVRKEENVRLLSEFNQLVADQLESEHTEFLFERVGFRYHHVLVDEFQDTSALQWKAIMPLIESSLASAQKNLIVGDAKQSIYRFRDSEPFQFIQLPKTNTSADPLFESSYFEHVLEDNYRSSANIVAFNNAFFKDASNLLDESLKDVYRDLEQNGIKQEKGGVVWHFQTDSKSKKADVFESMLGRVVSAVSTQEKRPGEICCLFRQAKDASQFAAQLVQRGVPVISDESLLLVNNPSVQLMVTVFKAIRLDNDPFLLQQVLARIHQVRPIRDYHKKAKALKEKGGNVLTLFRSLDIEISKTRMQAGNVFQAAFYLANAFKLNLADPFIQKFLDLCMSYESDARYLSEGFIDHWENVSAELSIDLPDGEDAVRVMTIHKSKGLEFPSVFVFLPDLFGQKLTKKSVWIDIPEDLEVGPMLVKTTQLKETHLEMIKTLEEQKSKMDALNITYVAFTRAVKHLEIFSGPANEKDPWGHLYSSPWWDPEIQKIIVA